MAVQDVSLVPTWRLAGGLALVVASEILMALQVVGLQTGFFMWGRDVIPHISVASRGSSGMLPQIFSYSMLFLT